MYCCAVKDELGLTGTPQSARALRGGSHWYLAQAPEGREQAICEKVRRVAGSELVEDAFVLRKEQWFKRNGAWSLQLVQMYRGYFFIATQDVFALDAVMSRLSFPARMVGRQGRMIAPLSDEVHIWLASAMDAEHVLRNSMGVIENGVLRVQSGPLCGQESRVSKIDRHHRRCCVSVSGGSAVEGIARRAATAGDAVNNVRDVEFADGRAGAVSVLMPLSVPVRS